MEQLAANDKKRLLTVTAGNLRQRHLYITGHHDFFPPDCFGPARKPANGGSELIEIQLDGLKETVRTDIPTDARTGKPRAFFRERSWVRRFFDHHLLNAGDQLALRA